MKNKTSAALFAIFLGGIGIHRFYLGQTGLGFVYLLFCWTLVPAVIAFIDFIVFLSMDESSFNKKYNKNQILRPQIQVNSQKNISVSDEIEKLYVLKEKGIITEQEFIERKNLIK